MEGGGGAPIEGRGQLPVVKGLINAELRGGGEGGGRTGDCWTAAERLRGGGGGWGGGGGRGESFDSS